MNTNMYDAGRSYYTPIEEANIARDDSNTGGKKVSKSTELFKNLVVSIASKSIDQIEADETASLIASLKSRRTGQTGDPERSLIDKAIQKVREREEMALNRSMIPGTVEKHKKNIHFLESVMEANHIQGSTTRALLISCIEKYYTLCNSIAQKSVDKINRSDVELFISLDLQIRKIIDDLKIKRKNLLDDMPQFKSIGLTGPRAYLKIMEREEMALNHSTWGESKERHERNLNILKTLKDLNL